MVAIGVFSDSSGDLEAFDAAVKLLAAKGARPSRRVDTEGDSYGPFMDKQCQFPHTKGQLPTVAIIAGHVNSGQSGLLAAIGSQRRSHHER